MGSDGLRALRVAVVAMGILIVAGVATLGVLLARRVIPSAPASASATLDEPTGTRIGGVAATADGLALLLQGGGPDRVVLVDPRSGRPRARVSLAR